MYNTAIRICGSEEDAEDVLQESFLSAFRNLSQYRGESSFGAWLKRIVINKAITATKREQKMSRSAEEQNEEAYHFEWDTGAIHESQMTVQKIQEAVKTLPLGFRSVLTLYLFEGYDHKEIAGILNISESTSKSQYNRAKKKLRDILGTEVKYG